jgi:sigma-E factor negative regulatory protein RseA
MNAQGPENSDGAARHEVGHDARQALSALMDGDADDGTVTRACAAWRAEGHARADWHTYHVIGDVLRTADQCPSSRGDAAFVEALRRRLELEPVVVAPASVAPAAVPVGATAVATGASTPFGTRRRGAWRAPIAAAAGVAAVAGVVFLMRPGAPDAQAPLVATAAPATSVPVPSPAPVLVATREAAPREAAPVVVVRDPRMLRDERLDRYLDAHRQFAEGALSVMPAGTVRGVSSLAPER